MATDAFRHRPGGSTSWLVLACILLVAFALRLLLGLRRGETDFLANGYGFYLDIAATFLQGHGLCLGAGSGCALREPVYPLFISPFLATGWLYPGLVVVQSAVGAALSWLAWKLARDLFDRRTAALAGAATALSPYAAIHDTALQDTVLVNTLLVLAVVLLLRSRQHGAFAWPGAGAVLAVAVLTTARVAMVVPCVLAWVAAAGGSTWARRGRNALLVAAPVLILVGGWTVRNWRVVGAPVLTTEAGESLWVANNDATFAHFPVRSIDASVREAYARLTPSERAELRMVSGDEVARDRMLARWGVQYLTSHPLVTLQNAIDKTWIVVSGQYSPTRGSAVQIGYALLFVPIHVLAAVGLWRSRRDWRNHGPVYALLLSFMITTAVFWAHTSHKSSVDVFLFIYASSVLQSWVTRDRAAHRWSAALQ